MTRSPKVGKRKILIGGVLAGAALAAGGVALVSAPSASAATELSISGLTFVECGNEAGRIEFQNASKGVQVTCYGGQPDGKFKLVAVFP